MKATFAHRAKLLRRGTLLSIGFVLFVVASLLWRTVLILGIAAVLALILQELAAELSKRPLHRPHSQAAQPESEKKD